MNKGSGNLTRVWIKLEKDNSAIRNLTTNKANEYTLKNLTPYTTYEISVAVGNKDGFGEETKTSFLTSEEGKNEINIISTFYTLLKGVHAKMKIDLDYILSQYLVTISIYLQL